MNELWAVVQRGEHEDGPHLMIEPGWPTEAEARKQFEALRDDAEDDDEFMANHVVAKLGRAS